MVSKLQTLEREAEAEREREREKKKAYILWRFLAANILISLMVLTLNKWKEHSESIFFFKKDQNKFSKYKELYWTKKVYDQLRHFLGFY